MRATMATTTVLLMAMQLVWMTLQFAYLYGRHEIDRFVRSTDRSIADAAAPLGFDRIEDECSVLEALEFARGSRGSLSYAITNPAAMHARQQRLSLVGQLNRGVRLLEIDADAIDRHDDSSRDCVRVNGVRTHFAWSRIHASLLLWLDQHPREIVILLPSVSQSAHGRCWSPRARSLAVGLVGRTVGEMRGKLIVWDLTRDHDHYHVTPSGELRRTAASGRSGPVLLRLEEWID